jgi:cob(I)alamin adenosyltransferase
MGHRLSRIATRTGDNGQTSLGSGIRVDKDAPPIEVLGAVDELNSWIGVVLTAAKSPEVRRALEFAQHDLFDLGAQISVPGTPLLSAGQLTRVDESFDEMNARLGMLKEFILPGGAPASAFAHVARTICRRAERRLYSLINQSEKQTGTQPVSEDYGLAYLNRLSDLLFVASRLENHAAGCTDIMWERGKSVSAEEGRDDR